MTSFYQCKLSNETFLFLGLSPKDIFDEAVANMICDGVEDLRNGCVKIYYEQDEAKKVNNKCCKVLFCRV